MKKQRLRHILTALILPVLIWFAWPKNETPGENPPNTSDSSSPRWSDRPRGSDDESPKFSTKNRQQPSLQNRANSVGEAGMARIDSLIAHQTLSDHEVAEQLLMIAKDKRMSDEVRAAALGHGAILDLPVFTGIAKDRELPQEMADNLLTHVINANEDPELQIQAYKEFLKHPSPEIREEAKQMLAFILEDDAGEADEATLVRMADAKLKELEAEKLAEE